MSSFVRGQNFVFEQVPFLYGNNHEVYTHEVNKIIEQAVKMIRCEVYWKANLKRVFFELLELFGEKRNEIARHTKTESAELFGVRRDLNEMLGNAYTRLQGQYQKYGDKMKSALQGIVSAVLQGAVDQTEYSEKSCYEDCESEFKVEILDDKKIEENGWLNPPDFRRIYSICAGGEVSPLAKLQRLKRKDPELYLHRLMHSYLSDAKEALESQKACNDEGWEKMGRWVMGTVYLTINKQRHQLSMYLAKLYANDPESDKDTINQISELLIAHQDPILIGDTLMEIANLFEKAVSWKKEKGDLDQLKRYIGLLRYLFAQCTPFVRGSAAIGEWFEYCLYALHDYKVLPWKDKTGDLEALTAKSLGEFMDTYMTETSLEEGWGNA